MELEIHELEAHLSKGAPGIPLFYDRRGNTVFCGAGEIPADYMIIIQQPSKPRAGYRRLWPAGDGTYRWLRNYLPPTSSLYITNMLDEPSGRGTKEPLIKQVRSCMPGLLQEIALVKPKRILTMGDTISRQLCGDDFHGLTEDHGTFFRNHELDAWVIPTWSMAKAHSSPRNKRFLSRDLERFFQVNPSPTNFVIHEYMDFTIPEGTVVALDIETTGLEWDATIISIGVGWDGVTHIILNPTPLDLVELGAELMRGGKRIVVGHNMPFDLTHILRVTKGNFPTHPDQVYYDDTMNLGYLTGEEVLRLKHLVTQYTDRPGSHSGGGWTDPAYLSEDVQGTRELYGKFVHYRQKEHRVFGTFAHNMLSSLVPIASQMRIRGIWAEKGDLQDIAAEAGPALRSIEEQLKDEADINWSSPAQVVDVLVARDYPLKERTEAGQYTLKEAALLALVEEVGEDSLLKLLLEYRSLKQLHKTFIEPYGRWLALDGYFHPRLKITGTRTGRFSMSDPNLQQVPRVGPIKRIFTSRYTNGHFGLVDLSGAELRIAALMSGDEAMAEAILSGDPHLRMASILYRKDPKDVTAAERKRSKAITFGLMYGGSSKGLAMRLNISTRQVDDILAIFKKEFPGLMKYLEYGRKVLVPQGYVISPFGKVRNLKDITDQYGVNSAYRKAVNTPIQGSASECMGAVLVDTWLMCEEQRLKTRPICLVHDSMEADIYPGEVEAYAKIVQTAFANLADSPLNQYELFNNPLPLIGELIVSKSGGNWGNTETTSEYFDKEGNTYFPCTTMK